MTNDELDAYFRNNFNTPLSDEDAGRFQNWANVAKRATGINVGDLYDYDMRGYWLNGGHAQPLVKGMHFPDTYKKPSHETFSDQSIYHGTMAPNNLPWMGGSWEGETFTPHPAQYRRK